MSTSVAGWRSPRWSEEAPDFLQRGGQVGVGEQLHRSPRPPHPRAHGVPLAALRPVVHDLKPRPEAGRRLPATRQGVVRARFPRSPAPRIHPRGPGASRYDGHPGQVRRQPVRLLESGDDHRQPRPGPGSVHVGGSGREKLARHRGRSGKRGCPRRKGRPAAKLCDDTHFQMD